MHYMCVQIFIGANLTIQKCGHIHFMNVGFLIVNLSFVKKAWFIDIQTVVLKTVFLHL